MQVKPLKLSVAFIIYAPGDRSRILTVQRANDDPDLPGVWGLPAASLKPGESYEDAIKRAGIEKLGVSLKVLRQINSGRIERSSFHLYMKDFEAAIISGTPYAPQQPSNGTSQYQRCELATPDRLVDGAEKGGLCSRLYLSYIGLRDFRDYK